MALKLHRWGPAPKIGIALFIPTIAAVIQYLLSDFLSGLYFFLFYPAVFLASWLLGLSGGVVATLWATLLAWYIFIPIPFSFEFSDIRVLGQLATFTFNGLLFSFLNGRLRRTMDQAERAYQNSKKAENNLNFALNAADMGVWTLNFVDGYVERAGKHDKLYGYQISPTRWTYESFIQALHPEDRSRVLDYFRTLLDSGGSNYSDEFRVIWPDGSAHWLASRAKIIREKNGAPQSMVGALMEITALKETQRSLVEGETALRKALEARDHFLSIASHELKTPITSLKLQLQMTKRAMAKSGAKHEGISERLNKAIEVSNAQVDRLTRLIEDLLDVTRIQAGKLGFSFEKFLLDKLVHDVVDRLRDELNEKQNSVVVEVPQNIEVNWDYMRMEQVLINLLSNAMKYAPGTKIIVHATLIQDLVVLSVIDHGPGIPTERHNTIFDRFVRADVSRHISGLGLGLFIVNEIVKGHTGTCRLDSTPNNGAKFILEIPRYAETAKVSA